MTAAGTRTFDYDGSLPRLVQDRFDGSSAPYFLERNYGGLWELANRLGTGMVMLDETGARVVHRSYTPFGVEHDSAGAEYYCQVTTADI